MSEFFKGLLNLVGLIAMGIVIYAVVKVWREGGFQKVPESRASIAQRVCDPGMTKTVCDWKVHQEEKKYLRAMFCQKKLKELADECASAGDIDRCVAIRAEKFGIKDGYITTEEDPFKGKYSCS